MNYFDKGANISNNQQYRYLLWRSWDCYRATMLWIMLNPSTADALVDDATIRVCVGRAQRMGCGGIDVVNLFALRSTTPRALYQADAPASEADDPSRNDRAIQDRLSWHPLVICAWGDHGALQGRGAAVLDMIRRTGRAAHALRLTRAGHPCHPLRIPYSQPLVRL